MLNRLLLKFSGVERPDTWPFFHHQRQRIKAVELVVEGFKVVKRRGWKIILNAEENVGSVGSMLDITVENVHKIDSYIISFFWKYTQELVVCIRKKLHYVLIIMHLCHEYLYWDSVSKKYMMYSSCSYWIYSLFVLIAFLMYIFAFNEYIFAYTWIQIMPYVIMCYFLTITSTKHVDMYKMIAFIARKHKRH